MALTAPGNKSSVSGGYTLPALNALPPSVSTPLLGLSPESATTNLPPPPATGEAALVTDQTGHYANAPFVPDGFQTLVALTPDLQVQALLSDLEDISPLLRRMQSEAPNLLPTIPPEKRARLDTLAHSLGFTSFRILQYQLRNMPPEKVQALLQSVKTNLLQLSRSNNNRPPNDTDLQKAVADGFESHLRTELNELFSSHGLPAPELKENGRLWDAASLASVYNALFEINERSPEKLAVIGRSTGQTPEGQIKPLSFTRPGEPQEGASNNFLETLNRSMFLAHADQTSEGISLSTTGVRNDVRGVVAQIAGSVSLLTRSVEGNVVPTYTAEELRDRGLNTENLGQLKAKLRAQGHLQPSAEDRFKDYLPQGFQGLLNDPEYIRSVTYGNSAACRISEAFLASANLLSPMVSGASGPLQDSTRLARRAREAQVRQLVNNPKFNQAWQLMSRTFQAYGQATGIPTPVTSRKAFARALLERLGNDPPDAAHLQSILAGLLGSPNT